MSEQLVTMKGVEFRVTTDHAASCHGQAVVVCPDGAALGAADLYETPEGLGTGAEVMAAANRPIVYSYREGGCHNAALPMEHCGRDGEVFDEEARGLLCAEHAEAADKRRAATGSAVLPGIVRSMDPESVDREHSTWLPAREVP